MTAPLRIRALHICKLAIPMRVRFEHAQASRAVADPVLVRIDAEAPYAELHGYGETLARSYVTGETADTVAEDLEEHFARMLLEFRATHMAEALEFADALPTFIDGRLVNAARAAVELALLDLAGRAFGRRLTDAAGWLELPRFGPPGALPRTRFSGVVVGSSPAKLKALLRAQRLFGLRDFKIKVAVEGWERRLEWAAAVLGRAIHAGRATLRADANAGWTPDEAAAALPALERHGVEALEQPVRPADDDCHADLARRAKIDLIADESLLTIEDADRLIEGGGTQVLNVRLAKNGGLLPSLRIAAAALAAGRDVQLGCLVGETSVLTGAGLAFLELCPRVRYAEGGFGRFLLKTDVVRRPLTFGYGGRLAARSGPGLGVEVDERQIEALLASPAVQVQF